MKTKVKSKLKFESLDEILAQFKEEKSDTISIFFQELGQLKKLSFYKKAFAFVAASCLISLIIIFIF